MLTPCILYFSWWSSRAVQRSACGFAFAIQLQGPTEVDSGPYIMCTQVAKIIVIQGIIASYPPYEYICQRFFKQRFFHVLIGSQLWLRNRQHHPTSSVRVTHPGVSGFSRIWPSQKWFRAQWCWLSWCLRRWCANRGRFADHMFGWRIILMRLLILAFVRT